MEAALASGSKTPFTLTKGSVLVDALPLAKAADDFDVAPEVRPEVVVNLGANLLQRTSQVVRFLYGSHNARNA